MPPIKMTPKRSPVKKMTKDAQLLAPRPIPSLFLKYVKAIS